MSTEPGDDELEVSDLRPVSKRERGAGPRGVLRMLRQWMWRWTPLALSLALLVALAVSALPQAGVLVRSLQTFGHSPTPVIVSSIQVNSPPGQIIVAPRTVLRTPPAPTLGQAPARCGAAASALTHVGPPSWGAAVGQAPVWLAGTSGDYPTMRLGPAATANAYSWNAPYTQFGWPAPIGLVLKPDFNAPVLLSGWDVHSDRQSVVSFGFVIAGDWGAPSYVSPSYQFYPSNPDLPAGGGDSTGVFWYGYAFFPHAGCYQLLASWPASSGPGSIWPAGSWQAIVSVGR